MIPASTIFDQPTLLALLEHDSVVAGSRAFFAELDWSLVERWETQQSGRGRPGHPMSAYLKAWLIRICEGFRSTTRFRHFLASHPLLVLDPGFHLVLDPAEPYGFDTLPLHFVT